MERCNDIARSLVVAGLALILSGCASSKIANLEAPNTVEKSEIKRPEDYGLREISLRKDGLGKFMIYSMCGIGYVSNEED